MNDISSSLMSRQRALPEQKRYLLHCVQPYRTPKTVRERNEVENGGGLDAIGNIQKRHEAWCDRKAARGRVAIQNIRKRHEDVSQSEIYQSGNKLPHSEIYQSGERLAALQKMRGHMTGYLFISLNYCHMLDETGMHRQKHLKFIVAA